MDVCGFWDCSNAEYHGSLTEDSHSSLDLFLESVEQYAARRVFRTVPSPSPNEAMLFGTLFHTTVLEPHLIDEDYIEYEKFDRRTKDGKSGFADFCQRAGNRTVVTREDLDKAREMFEGVMRNPEARRLLELPGRCELAYRWTDADSGLPLKIRMDKYNNDGTIVDLKTTDHVSPESWSRTTHNFGYHRQAAMYIDGIKSGKMHFIACSKTPPHECVVYDLGFNTLNLGRSENRGVLFELAYRRRENIWTGRWSGRSNTIDVPAYALNKGHLYS